MDCMEKITYSNNNFFEESLGMDPLNLGKRGALEIKIFGPLDINKIYGKAILKTISFPFESRILKWRLDLAS